MIIYPAIDLSDGIPVRLTKGDFATAERVSFNALTPAQSFERAGATHLHMVDLDGALTGAPVNDSIVKKIVENTELKIQIGGGIRTDETISYYLYDIGVYRVILGSIALRDPDFAKAMIEKYGDRIAIGIDAKYGKVAGEGWLGDSDTDFIDLARAMSEAGAETIIYTDIERDGTLTGPDLEGLRALNEAVPADIIASGGVATIEDIDDLAALDLAGVICGRAIYRGTLTLREALLATGN